MEIECSSTDRLKHQYEVGDVGRRLRDACLSGSVTALEALIGEDELILNRVSSLTGFFINGTTPLHIAASLGHLDLTKALLTRKPELATELDSSRSSPLHLACAEGRFEIIEELLRVNTHVCLGHDEDDRIPLHLAAIKGRVEVIPELLQAKPESIHEKLGKRETVLHLCVKYNRLEALKTLVQYLQNNDNESLLNSRDNDGNTILHLAAALKQMDTIEYLLEIQSVKDHANVKNQNGSTALDFVEHCPYKDFKTMKIREFLLQAGVQRSPCNGSNPKPELLDKTPPPPYDWQRKAGKVWQHIYLFWIKYFMVNHTWLREVRGHLITAATLTATMAYQAILSPPGGFWQEPGKWNQTMSPRDGDVWNKTVEHSAGTAILDSIPHIHIRDYYYNIAGINNSNYYSWYFSNYGNPLRDYLYLNTLVLIGSFCTIMLALSGFPATNKFLMWLLIFTVYFTIICMSTGYFFAMSLVFPIGFENNVSAFYIIWYFWIGLCVFVFVLHTWEFLVWLRNKFENLKWLRNKFVDLVKTCFGSIWHYISG